MHSLSAEAEGAAAEADFTAEVVEASTEAAEAGSMVAAEADFGEAGSAGVDAHSAEAGDRTAARIAGVERLAGEHIAVEVPHRAALAVPVIDAADSARARLEDSRRADPDLAAEHFPA